MNFFQHQDRARIRSRRFTCLLFLTAAITVLSVSFLTAYLADYNNDLAEYSYWDLFTFSAIAFTVIFCLASLYRKYHLRAGGKAVALELGGTLILPNNSNLEEQTLINIVEEMSIASGMPIPEVYVIDELGINAFVAGFDLNDAVVVVTRGALANFTRDEMQGVIAHEFSHIFNGDMRLNLRMTSMIYGLLCIGMLGYFIVRSRARRGRRHTKGSAMILPLGVVLAVVGSIGTFFGVMIKAMVSRQREYLADASAVQFTRNPDGIASALKKILFLTNGSEISNPKASQFSHMFFSDSLKTKARKFFKMATHPPLKIRILAIEPSWDGEFQDKKEEGDAVVSDEKTKVEELKSLLPVVAVSNVGDINQESIDEAHDVIAKIPTNIKNFTSETLGAEAVIYSLLVELDGDFRQKRLQILEDNSGDHFNILTKELHVQIGELDKKLRLPLIELSIASLRYFTAPQYKNFKRNVSLLVKADAKVSLFEWSLSKILFNSLDQKFVKKSVELEQCYNLEDAKEEFSLFLSLMAYAGHKITSKAKIAFETTILSHKLVQIPFTPKNKIKSLNKAILKLEKLKPLEKEKLLNACSHCIFQNEVFPEEVELFTAFAAVLNCPVALRSSATK
jgi:Zn-dependent protease with chaperone function